LSKLIDRWIIRLAAAHMPRTNGLKLHLDEANQLLRAPDFFCDFVTAPKDFKPDGETFQFTSSIATPWQENNIVHGKIFSCGENWQSRPVVILLHGWNDELNYRFRFPRLAHALNRYGINCATLELPYHFRRRPREAGAVRNFFSQDMLRTVEATRQAVADIRALRHWLGAQGGARVGVWGISLGAWLGGLLACHEPKINFAVLMMPVARTDRCVEELKFCEPIRQSLQGATADTKKFNLIEHRPLVPKENILLVEAEHDLFVPKETVEELWRDWNEPEIWRLPHGHISILLSSRVMKRAVEWIVAKTGN